MRPGILGNVDYWFSGFNGNYYQVEEVHSAQPTFLKRNVMHGKTAYESKTKLPRTIATLIIPKKKLSANYSYTPYPVFYMP